MRVLLGKLPVPRRRGSLDFRLEGDPRRRLGPVQTEAPHVLRTMGTLGTGGCRDGVPGAQDWELEGQDDQGSL